MLEAVTAPVQLILASTSRYRSTLLQRLEVPFAQRAPEVDERAYEHRFAAMNAEDFALLLATAKAQRVAAMLRDESPEASELDSPRWVLGADQLAILPGDPPELLHKPGTAERAIEQLMRMSGREHHLVTGVVLCEVPQRAPGAGVAPRRFHGVDRVVLRMREFDRVEATAYVQAHLPLDCAGSYRIEDAGIRLIGAIDGSADPTSIIGLPLLVVARLLRRAGVLPA